MAGQVKFCFAFLLVCHVSLVSCRPDHHQYFSQYIKDESTTGSSLSSTTGISTGKSENISNPEVPYSENVISPKANSYSASNNNVYEKPVQSAYSDYNGNDSNSILKIRLILIFGIIVTVGVILCCIAVCCPRRFKGRERRGYILSTNAPEQPTVNLVQPLMPQAFPVQQYPTETQTPQHPPPYDTQSIQQQFQYPSSEHSLHQYPMQPVDQQQSPIQPMGLQQPLMPYAYSNPDTVSPPYPTKY